MTKPDDLRAALYRVIGSLTDERVDAVLRAEAIPLHGKALSDDLRARYVAATLRAHLKEGIDAALAAASGAERPIDEERLSRALHAEREEFFGYVPSNCVFPTGLGELPYYCETHGHIRDALTDERCRVGLSQAYQRHPRHGRGGAVMTKPDVEWTVERSKRLERHRDLLWTTLSENACGDADCEGFRVEAARFVLVGGSTHRAYAELVNRAAAKRPVLSLPLSVEMVSEVRERFAALPLGDELREAGLMLVEALVTAQAGREQS